MWGTNTKLTDEILYKTVSNVYRKNKGDWQNKLSSINKNVSIHISRDIPYSFIKDAMEYYGKYANYIGTTTDNGGVKKNSTDGGVIYVQIENIKLPINWFEVKTSYSCTTGKGTRGQATGLISEQESRCRAWASSVNYKVKPLVAFMQGTDFNEKFGKYNIDRIRMDLHTRGNENPYVEGNDDGVAWLFYQEKFTQIELENLIFEAINTNINKIIEIISTFVQKK